MKGFFSTVLFLVLVFAWDARGDDAPKVQAGIVLNAPITPSITTIPVTVSNFIDIGSFTLSLDYDSTVVQYAGYIPNAAFTSMTISVTAPGGTAKRLTISWPAGGTGITLPDQAVLLNLTFKYKISGSRSFLTWYNSGASCQFTKYAGGSYTVLVDLPTESFYYTGVITNHSAPYTVAPYNISAIPNTTVEVPIIISNIYNVGSITLSLIYDPAVLTYQTFTQNSGIPGSFSVGSNTHPITGVTTMNMGYWGTPFGLPDGSTLLTLLFTYSNAGSGNYSELTWQTYPNAACEFSDGQYRLLYDAQPSIFYTNGLVASQLSPKTWLPTFTDASPSTSLPVEVKVNDFDNISSFTLSFKYDPAVITYNSVIPNAAFNGLLNVVNNPVAPDGTRTISMTWTGTSPLTLADQTVIANLDFTYISGTTTLSWVIDDITSCRFNDESGNAFYDKIKSTYYQNGAAASQLSPRTAAWYASPATGQPVTVPVVVFDYSGIGLFCLTLDYDPGVLTYLGADLVPALGGSFTAASPGPGRIVMNWTGTAASLADSTVLLNLNFTYNEGETALAWYDNGASSRYAESSGSDALYDQPRSLYYINGYVGPTPLVANFTANNTLTPENVTVSFTDLSTGSPTSWNWVFSPPTVDFVNGTNSNSQHPQVRFTANGVYTVSLIEYRGMAGGIKVKSDYIFVGIPGLWTGISSSEWNTSSNWHNYRIPDGNIDVIIPSSANYWPVFNGEFIMGTHCRNLLLQGGGNCTMTIRPN